MSQKISVVAVDLRRGMCSIRFVHRIRWILTLLAVCLAGSVSMHAFATSAGSPPNIVLIVADYMGYADTEPYGSTDIKTPSLSDIARAGVRFDSHYAAAPTCIPSRAALLSGRYPSRVLERMNRGGRGLRDTNNFLLAGLKKRGYRSAMIGKWHLGSEPAFRPNDHGFDYFFGFDDWTLSSHSHRNSGGEPGLLRNGEHVVEEGYLTDLFSEESIRFIDRNRDRHFFLYLAYNGGLPPYQRPDLPRSEWHRGWNAGKSTRGDYRAMIERMDQGIGNVLRSLQAHKLLDNTLLVFTYDHGGRHLVDSGPLFHGFGSLWEGGIRVPLIVRGRQFKHLAGHRIIASTVAMDVTATMLDAAGVSRGGLDGQTLIGIANDDARFLQRPLFWRHGRMTAMRRGDWKYVIDGHTQFLFDLKNDIGERRDLFHLFPQTAREYQTELARWEEAVDRERR